MPETVEPREPPGSVDTPVAGLTTVRRAPRYRAFALTGAAGGLAVGGLVAALVGVAPTAPAIAMSAVVCGLLGGWLGALVAVLLDRER